MAKPESDEPELDHQPLQHTDQLSRNVVEHADKWRHKAETALARQGGEKKGPAGGFDATPIPKAPPGYTLKITFHKAENLPFADLGTLSSDPYIHATLKTDLPKRHKQDPDLTLRTPTIHRNVNPEWNVEWIVANIPASGFFLKCRLYDEDVTNHDDRLGNAHINVSNIDTTWTGFTRQKFELKKRMASKRAYTFRGCAALFSGRVKMNSDLIVSVENLGQTPGQDGGRAYTVGPLAWSRHFSPLIGRITGTKDIEESKDGKKRVERYNFQAVQMQFRGPVPAELYHRYVEFRPFIAGMFTARSLQGRLLNRALHHQHGRIYNYDRSTKYGAFAAPCEEMTRQFLEFVHYDQGGRIFTYVLTLDGQWRFTETGKEYRIDLLSKHTMHSDVSFYIAFSGEFFIRRLRHPHKEPSSPDRASHKAQAPTDAADPDHQEGPTPAAEPSKDPKFYELVIDNDSGTYRPNAQLLHVLRHYMAENLPGLRVVTLDCQADAEKMKKLKDEQRERKAKSGKQITYMQNISLSSLSSISSSDEEALDAIAEGREFETRYKREMHKFIGGGQDLHHGDDPVLQEANGGAADEYHDKRRHPDH